MISIYSISVYPSVHNSVQLHDDRAEKIIPNESHGSVCMWGPALRKEKQFSCLPFLLGILLTTWHSAWLTLTDAWHISYRRSKNFTSWLQFLYIKSTWSKEPNVLLSGFFCAYVQHMGKYMCILSCRKHASPNMGKIQWSKFTVDINAETPFVLMELCSLTPVLNSVLELNPPKS